MDSWWTKSLLVDVLGHISEPGLSVGFLAYLRLLWAIIAILTQPLVYEQCPLKVRQLSRRKWIVGGQSPYWWTSSAKSQTLDLV